jgi:DNA-binding transcriptional MocR family regulator
LPDSPNGYRSAVIHPPANRSTYRQIAAELRRRIASGEYPPGSRFRSETDIQQEWGVSRWTAREVMRLLKHDGLILIRHGQPTQVSNTRPMSVVPVPSDGSPIGARPASEAEATQYDIPEGYPMLTLHDAETGVELEAWPADRTRLRPEVD